MKTLIAIAAVALSFAAPAAYAQTTSEPISVAISYADLDLSKDTARKVLERRVASAVDRVCPNRPMPQEVRKSQLDRACHRAAWTGARQQLASLYNGRAFAQASLRVSADPN